MDLAILLNALSLTIAIGAAATAVWMARRQLRTAQAANQLQVIAQVFTETLSDEWSTAHRFVTNELASAEPEKGLRELPEPKRRYAFRTCFYYDNIGKMVAHGVVSSELAIGSWGGGARKTWQILAPFIYAERRIRGNHTMAYFEDFAWRANEVSPEQVHRRLGLKKLPPTVARPLADPATETRSETRQAQER